MATAAIVNGILGAVGGLLRAIVGLAKAKASGRRIIWPYFFITVIVATGIGAVAGLIIGINRPVSLLAGYAGTDLLEGIAKAFRISPVKIS
jgi:hypothetical protein